ncbi:MAG: UDP-3-O-(3-hydroxymyristoyl)glucosamine N-acyltransferase [bacterium]
MKLAEICQIVEGRIDAAKIDFSIDKLTVENVNTLDEANEKELTFLSNPKYLKNLGCTKALVVLIAEKLFNNIPKKELDNLKKVFLVVKNPQIALSKLLKLQDTKVSISGISKKASISEGAELADGISVGDFSVIEAGVGIGTGTVIYPRVFIGSNAKIGKNCILYPNVVIGNGCILENNIILQSGVVIGSDGFGYAEEKGVQVKIPQVGIVYIEDDVEVGANSVIDRATIGKTRIGAGTKIDNLVHIAHNVTIGKNCVIVALVGISGSTKVGNNVTLAGQAGVAGHLNIGDRVVAGARSGIIGDIPSDSMVSGFPARPHREMMKIIAATYKLPKIINRLSRSDRE